MIDIICGYSIYWEKVCEPVLSITDSWQISADLLLAEFVSASNTKKL